MYTLSASEVKRRGVIAIEEHLDAGPIHIIKHNEPVCVVLSEDEYARITKSQISMGLEQLIKKPATGQSTRKQLDTKLKHIRTDWD